MLGILYLITCLFTGYTICIICIKNMDSICKETYDKKEITLSNFFFIGPASFLVGTCLVTWYVYLVAYCVCVSGINSEEPLLLANVSAFLLFLLIDIVILTKRKDKFTFQISSIKIIELIGMIGVIVITTYIMTDVFQIIDDTLYVGSTVFCDFGAHIPMIRSFSQGNNFPTMYPHFTGEDVKYHFMFQFLAGNLEYLGMRLDYAFNVPSILSFLSMISLFYVLVNKIFEKRRIAGLSVLFILFRPSLAAFTFFAKIPKEENFWAAIWNKDVFLGNTELEEWGLYILNAYCNQRHLAYALGVMLLVLIIMLPYLYDMDEILHVEKYTNKQKLVNCFFNKGCFGSKDCKLMIFLGLLLGGIAFWNGLIMVGTVAILFFMAVFSNHRLDYVILAGITLVLSLLQSTFFVDGVAVNPRFCIGYRADPNTFFGILAYMVALSALILIVLIIYLFSERKLLRKYLVFVFMVPYIMAFTISLTSDVVANHKWILISIIFSSMFVAVCIDKIFSIRRIGYQILSGILLLVILITGVLNFHILIQKNEWKLEYNLNSDKVKWIEEYSDSKDVFLSNTYNLNEVVVSGVMLYYGSAYCSWTAGYDVWYRGQMVKEMYGATDENHLKELVQQEGITYIIVEKVNRDNTEYEVQEDVIAKAFKQVYTEGEGEWKFTIYDTRQAP